MNMPLIAAAAMAGGALLGFSLCWATLTACVFGVCGFENGVMGWIKTTKEKQAAARTNGSGQTAAPVEPPTEREEPPDAGIK